MSEVWSAGAPPAGHDMLGVLNNDDFLTSFPLCLCVSVMILQGFLAAQDSGEFNLFPSFPLFNAFLRASVAPW
jgi:hypothetical protein